jgi:hypothetical protein
MDNATAQIKDGIPGGQTIKTGEEGSESVFCSRRIAGCWKSRAEQLITSHSANKDKTYATYLAPGPQ